uniref:VTT domain-containing protein n=1 Tax=Coccolithus braarudii TaxID=221442 RepID=A0A7S0L5F6_9EUKA|mmetsp:Transcript_21555/g.46392  ORF Transcript_21555/g.46392 Transcript_21555/m.46392 type:complete len:283 (+) Transcript_21555:32-880(+)
MQDGSQPNSHEGGSSKADVTRSQNRLYVSLGTYLLCIGVLAFSFLALLSSAPAVPGTECAGLEFAALFDREGAGLLKMWRCAKVYQAANWWFVVGTFEAVYVGLKTFAIPATFSLSILAGALFPLPVAQLLTGLGEGFGSSLCYLQSRAIAGPLVEHFFSGKLEMLRARAAQEREHMLLFNFFLRLTPFMPNWFINIASPLVGVPLPPFFVGSLVGTQLSLLFLSLTGATLRDVGESGFELGADFRRKGLLLGLTMGVLQCVPLLFIWLSKRAKQHRGLKED